ncbi:MAG: cell division protein ZapE [Gammaproteobacteria bacterium]|nr:cell division protein ZapE [Gammaproteobacteria bacterium]MCY4219181.1 cell division protein ZapE [Gammaproteobacteria bacterium]
MISSTGHHSPSVLYQRLLDDGSLNMDSSQDRALQQLDLLQYELLTNTGERKSSRLKELLSFRLKKPPTGCYLWGSVGTGKTLLMDLFVSSLSPAIVYRTHFHRFMRSVHHKKNQIKEQIDPLKSVAKDLLGDRCVLCLDEFTVSDIADAMIMATLLGHLFERRITLVTTSNTPPDQLYWGGLQRDRFLPAIELIKDHTSSIEVDNGKDYRMEYLSGTNTFMVPSTDETEASLRSAFIHLAGPNPSFNTKLEINGRLLEAKALGADTVWFSFEAICQTHRSNLDYIEIAQQFHTMIISDIPQLGSDMDDSARRFIELIDELYDRNVNLLASSDYSPKDIYQGKRLMNAFQRTQSRLVEMSSTAYLSSPHK